MFRKIALGLFAAVAVTAASLAPAAAKGGFHVHHGHWGVGWGGGFYNSSAYYVGSNCYQQIVVQTHRGPRLRVVNTCGYIY